MMRIHSHDYQPHPDMPTVKVCAVEDCDAHENDGQETWLGQWLLDEKWVDYARGPMHAAISWASDAPDVRRIVYWTRKGEPVWPEPSILAALPDDDEGMWVVWVIDSGWSDESMRFATKREARDYINERTMPWEFDIRHEP